MVGALEAAFPSLARGGYRITSPPTKDYNCVAWACGQSSDWWWPIPQGTEIVWPAGAPNEETIAAFRAAFGTLGYLTCDGPDLEPGFEKIALFALPGNVPSHVARQLSNGRWTSKLGMREDIEHALHDLEGEWYGTVVLFMKRPWQPLFQNL
jgi:hypothetical protein